MLAAMPVVRWALLTLGAIELLGCAVLPLLLPESVYLQAYLGPRARQAAAGFVARRQYLIPDAVTGWRNAPDYRSGNWTTDALGARIGLTAATTGSNGSTDTAPVAGAVVLLGSSLVNGGRGVEGDQTISAGLSRSGFDAHNFGTMLYSADQSLLLLERGAMPAGVRHVVVGIDADPTALLGSVFVPVADREQVDMPFFKPRFLETRRDPVLPPLALLQAGKANAAAVRDFLARYDARAWRYELFRRTAFTPVAAGVRKLFWRADEIRRHVLGDPGAEQQLVATLTRLKATARDRGVTLTVLAFPSRSIAEPGCLRRYLPDLYGARLGTLKNAGLRVLDLRSVLAQSGLRGDLAWDSDGVHLQARANAAIAVALAVQLRRATVSSE